MGTAMKAARLLFCGTVHEAGDAGALVAWPPPQRQILASGQHRQRRLNGRKTTWDLRCSLGAT
jgi:hypothetical protein